MMQLSPGQNYQRGREGDGGGLSLLLAVETYPRSVSITWLAGCNPGGGGLVSSTAGSVSPLVCTISVGPFVVTFSITGILSSRAGLKEADIVTLCHLPRSQSKYSDVQETIYTGSSASSF